MHQMVKRMIFEKNGSVQQQLTVPEVQNFKIPYLSSVDMREYESKTTVLVERIHLNKQEIDKLNILRDELLPLLMNGQVSVMPTEVNCDLAALILRRGSNFGSVLPNHLCATMGLDNQCSRFRTQSLLPRRMPHHNIGKCGFWDGLYPY